MTRRERAGFTLIELLVVIAIIAIIAAILFPIFARAKAAAQVSRCCSNLSNICRAMAMYRDDNNGRNCHIWQNSGQRLGAAANDRGSFTWVIMRYVGQHLDYDNKTGSENLSHDNVYRCPSAPKSMQLQHWRGNFDQSGFDGLSYTMNETGWTDTAHKTLFAAGGLRDSQFRRPSETIFVTECLGWVGFGVGYQDGRIIDNEHPRANSDGWSSVGPPPDEDIPLSDPRYLGVHHGSRSKIYNLRTSHNLGAMCLFYDGHAKLMKTTKGRNWSVWY